MEIEVIVYSRNNWTGEDKMVVEIFEGYETYGKISYTGHGTTFQIRFFTRSFVSAMSLVEDLVLGTSKNINVKQLKRRK